MATANEMLLALHKADPKTLNQRYSPQQLQAAYAKLQGSKPAAGGASQPSGYQYPKNINDVRTGMQANQQAAATNQQNSIAGQNANINGPFGSSTTTIDPNTGQATVNQNLSPEQQGIYQAGSQLSQTGLNQANQRLGDFASSYTPQTIGRVSTGDLTADRQKYEDAMYSRLTKGLDQQRSQEMAQQQQDLVNRGIPVGSDAYNRAMQQFNSDWNDRFDNARNQAVIGGGNEQQQQVGINEQVIANQQQQGWQNRTGNLSELGTMSGLGTGLQVPNFPQYQGSAYNAGLPTDVAAQQASNRINSRQVDAQIEALKRRGGGGRPSGGGSNSNPSPFLSGGF